MLLEGGSALEIPGPIRDEERFVAVPIAVRGRLGRSWRIRHGEGGVPLRDGREEGLQDAQREGHGCREEIGERGVLAQYRFGLYGIGRWDVVVFDGEFVHALVHAAVVDVARNAVLVEGDYL